MPITERPHSEPIPHPIPEGAPKYFVGGEVYENIGDNVNTFTAIMRDRQLNETGRKTVLVPTDTEEHEAWILPQERADWADRISLIEDKNKIEFTHFNGTREPLQAQFSTVDGKLDWSTLQLEPGVETTVPSQISPAAITDIKEMFFELKNPQRGGYSFSGLQNFASSPKLLGVFEVSQH